MPITLLEQAPANLDVGQRAPDFKAETHDGTEIVLSTLCRDRIVVLFFYPRDETPGCTKEACAFRDIHDELADAGAMVIGVSADSNASHRSFAQHHRLPFPLIADEGRVLRSAFGVKRSLGLFDGRKTFVLDHERMVRHVFDSQLQATRHVDEARSVVRALVGERAA